jgi:hypothetical protein
MSDVSEPTDAKEYILGANEVVLCCQPDDVGRPSPPRDKAVSERVNDKELLLRTWVLVAAGEFARVPVDRREYESDWLMKVSWFNSWTVK